MVRAKRLIVTFTAFFFVASFAFAQKDTSSRESKIEQPSKEGKEKQQKLRGLMDKTCKRFEITSETKKSKTNVEVVFRWDNPLRGSADGCTALWYDDQRRPIALASVYPINDTMNHDFDLLDRRGGATGSLKGKQFWETPKNSRLKFKPIAGVPEPSGSAKLRSVQLKLIARQFSVDLLGWGLQASDREKLRMLATPVHRYTPKKQDSDVSEGALFLFVQGVDPEAALLIEAHRHEGKLRWEYAFVPQTSAALEAKYKKALVWKKGVNQPAPSQGVIRMYISTLE